MKVMVGTQSEGCKTVFRNSGSISWSENILRGCLLSTNFRMHQSTKHHKIQNIIYLKIFYPETNKKKKKKKPLLMQRNFSKI